MMHLMYSRLTTSAESRAKMADGYDVASAGSSSRRSRSCGRQDIPS